MSRAADLPPPAAPAFDGICDLGISEDELAHIFALPLNPPVDPTAAALPDEVWSTLGDGRLSSSMGSVSMGGDDSSTAGSAGPSTFNVQGYHQNPFDSGTMGDSSSSSATGGE